MRDPIMPEAAERAVMEQPCKHGVAMVTYFEVEAWDAWFGLKPGERMASIFQVTEYLVLN